MIFNIMKKLDSIINKTPIKPLELKNVNSDPVINNENLTQSKTEPAILVEKYYVSKKKRKKPKTLIK